MTDEEVQAARLHRGKQMYRCWQTTCAEQSWNTMNEPDEIQVGDALADFFHFINTVHEVDEAIASGLMHYKAEQIEAGLA